MLSSLLGRANSFHTIHTREWLPPSAIGQTRGKLKNSKPLDKPKLKELRCAPGVVPPPTPGREPDGASWLLLNGASISIEFLCHKNQTKLTKII
jgi:hypothetical protein